MAQIGDIIVNVLARTQGFSRGMTNAQRTMKRFDNDAQKVARSVRRVLTGVVALGTGVGLQHLVSQAIELNTQLANTSERLGVGAQELKTLQVAAGLTGNKIEALNLGLQRMTRRVAEASVGMGEAQGALKELGLDAERLVQLSPDQQFLAIGEAMASVTTQSDRIRLGFKLFDSEGVGLVNTLRLGRDELEQLSAQLEATNASLTGLEVAKLEQVSDAIRLQKELLSGVGNTIALEVAPALAAMSESFAAALVEAGGFQNGIAAAFRGILVAVGLVGDAVQGLAALFNFFRGAAIGAIRLVILGLDKLNQAGIAVLNGIGGLLGFDGPFGDGRTVLTELAESLAVTQAGFNELGFAVFENGRFSEQLGQAYQDATVRANEKAAAVDQLRQRIRSLTEEQRAQLEIERKAREEAQAFEDLKRAASGIVNRNKTPQQRATEDIQLLQEALVKGAISAQDFQLAMSGISDRLADIKTKGQEAFEPMKEFAIQAARNMQSIFANFFKNLGGGFKGVVRDFAKMLRDMLAELLAQKLLLSFFGFLSKQGGLLGKVGGFVLGGLKKSQFGNSLAAGEPSIVGEGGRELFVPTTPGVVIPNHKLGALGGGVSIVNHNDFRGADSGAAARIAADLDRRDQALMGQIADLRRRGRFP